MQKHRGACCKEIRTRELFGGQKRAHLTSKSRELSCTSSRTSPRTMMSKNLLLRTIALEISEQESCPYSWIRNTWALDMILLKLCYLLLKMLKSNPVSQCSGIRELLEVFPVWATSKNLRMRLTLGRLRVVHGSIRPRELLASIVGENRLKSKLPEKLWKLEFNE